MPGRVTPASYAAKISSMKLPSRRGFVLLIAGLFACGSETRAGPDKDAGPEMDAGPNMDAGPDATSPTGPTLLAAGQFFTCALLAGRVACWCNNQSGQLGDGSGQSKSGAVFVAGIDDAVEI